MSLMKKPIPSHALGPKIQETSNLGSGLVEQTSWRQFSDRLESLGNVVKYISSSLSTATQNSTLHNDRTLSDTAT